MSEKQILSFEKNQDSTEVLSDVNVLVRRTVTIPASNEHHGIHSITIEVDWKCPVCGGPRGETYETISYDGSRRLSCDGWKNPCGHIDKYSEVRKEAF